MSCWLMSDSGSQYLNLLNSNVTIWLAVVELDLRSCVVSYFLSC